jgi:hypothetical protein
MTNKDNLKKYPNPNDRYDMIAESWRNGTFKSATKIPSIKSVINEMGFIRN